MEALLLDTQGFVSEGSGENIFLVKNGRLITPSLSSALEGITRDTIIEIAKTHDIQVIEKNITRGEIYTADEALFTGTAAKVTPIRALRRGRSTNHSDPSLSYRRRARIPLLE